MQKFQPVEVTQGVRLPSNPAGLVGREAELRAIQQRLQEVSLVTLVGPGGIGKSRLALQIAWSSALESFWCEVEPSETSLEGLIFSLAEALGLSLFGAINAEAQLLDYLRPRQFLLVVDNAEHLGERSLLLDRILAAAPGGKILVTSRVRLNLETEWWIEVDGLPYPSDPLDPHRETFAAVQLFLQETHRVQGAFLWTEADRAAVARICRLVDGVPLALEMAAAWTRVLSLGEIEMEIERSLDFLSSRRGDVPDRHRSLRAVFESSWALLSEAEREACGRLALFRGSIQRAAAEQVAQVRLGTLAALVDTAFLKWDPTSRRYWMHPLVHQYAAECYQEEGARVESLCQRHCIYFIGLLAGQEDRLRGREQVQALAQIAVEIDNIQQAWEWAWQNRREQQLAMGMEGLARFYEIRGWYTVGEQALGVAAQALALTMPEMRVLVGRLRARQAVFIFRARQIDRAREVMESCLPLLQGLPADEAFCLSRLAFYIVNQCRYAEAQEMVRQALTLAQAQGLRTIEAECEVTFGEIALRQGNLQAAEGAFERARQIYNEVGDWRGEASTFYNLGWVLMQRGNYRVATVSIEQSLEISRELGDLFGQSACLDSLSTILRHQFRYGESLKLREQALNLIRQTGYRRAEAVALSNLGTLLSDMGDYAGACRQYEAALAIYRAGGSRWHECIELINLGRLWINLEDPVRADETARQALEIAGEDDDPALQGLAWNLMGLAALLTRSWNEALTAFDRAYAIQVESGMQGRALESLSGAALAELGLGNLAQAQAHITTVWEAIGPDEAEIVDDDLFMHLACYKVWQAAGNGRSRGVLQTAYRRLMERADRMVDPAVRAAFLENVPLCREVLRAFAGAEKPELPESEPEGEVLTRQEVEVLRLLAEGLTNQQVAERLFITVGTVKFHVHNLYLKLGAQNRTQAVALGRERGWLG